MQQIIGKCWADEAFKSQLKNDPAATLQAEGLTLPAGVAFKTLENSGQLLHLVIPFRPTTLTGDKLAQGEDKTQQIIAKCWTDEAFKSRLIANPAATLQADGVTFPAGVTVKVMANSSQLVHVIIPFRPTVLSDADLEQVAGGGKTGQTVGGILGGIAGGGGGPIGAAVGGAAGTYLGGWLEDQGVFSGW